MGKCAGFARLALASGQSRTGRARRQPGRESRFSVPPPLATQRGLASWVRPQARKGGGVGRQVRTWRVPGPACGQKRIGRTPVAPRIRLQSSKDRATTTISERRADQRGSSGPAAPAVESAEPGSRKPGPDGCRHSPGDATRSSDACPCLVIAAILPGHPQVHPLSRPGAHQAHRKPPAACRPGRWTCRCGFSTRLAGCGCGGRLTTACPGSAASFSAELSTKPGLRYPDGVRTKVKPGAPTQKEALGTDRSEAKPHSVKPQRLFPSFFPVSQKTVRGLCLVSAEGK